MRIRDDRVIWQGVLFVAFLQLLTSVLIVPVFGALKGTLLMLGLSFCCDSEDSTVITLRFIPAFVATKILTESGVMVYIYMR